MSDNSKFYELGYEWTGRARSLLEGDPTADEAREAKVYLACTSDLYDALFATLKEEVERILSPDKEQGK